jgi:hypothetical protein
MPLRLFRIAVVYLMIGIAIAVYMAATHDRRFVGIHVHANLLGWATLALAAVAYHLFPSMQSSRLATAHFWLHNIGLPPGLIGVSLVMAGHPDVGGPVAGIATIAMVLGLAALALNLFINAGRPQS